MRDNESTRDDNSATCLNVTNGVVCAGQHDNFTACTQTNRRTVGLGFSNGTQNEEGKSRSDWAGWLDLERCIFLSKQYTGVLLECERKNSMLYSSA
ncbi:hypothetical protein J6590_044103 [Homalodisca vitripennis]|nr:hypothetical protein J6590_044103 [Homalodisca vitripennis]